MASWILIPCLVSLRDEFNRLAPGRDKGADGSIGDSSHTSTSDHTPDEDSDVLRDHDADSKNEVHALDIDSTGPWPRSFNSVILDLVAREKAEYESANVFGRLQYVIWNRRIASRSWGWTWRDYTGSDPHTNHAHFSARYTTAQESDTRPWGVEGDTLSAAEVNEIKAAVNAAVTALRAEINQAAGEVWGTNAGSTVVPGRTTGNIIKDVGNGLRPAIMFEPGHPEAKAAGAHAGSPIAIINSLPATLNALLSEIRAGRDAGAVATALAPKLLAGLPSTALTLDEVREALRDVLLNGAAQ